MDAVSCLLCEELGEPAIDYRKSMFAYLLQVSVPQDSCTRSAVIYCLSETDSFCVEAKPFAELKEGRKVKGKEEREDTARTRMG